MALFTPPTDRLAKFLAVGGLSLALASAGWLYRIQDAQQAELATFSELEARVVAGDAELAELRASGQSTASAEERQRSARRDLLEYRLQMQRKYGKDGYGSLFGRQLTLLLVMLTSAAASMFGFWGWASREEMEDTIRVLREE